ncbi:MAG: M24 family metallopeptidase [Oscillospiraceae bacterium]
MPPFMTWVRRANEAAEALGRPGVVPHVPRWTPLPEALVAAEGYGEYFTHRLGHFSSARPITASSRATWAAQARRVAGEGMIFSIEAGCLPAGRDSALRVAEDLVLVTAERLRGRSTRWTSTGA